MCNFQLSVGLKLFHSVFRFYTMAHIWILSSSLFCYVVVNLRLHKIHLHNKATATSLQVTRSCLENVITVLLCTGKCSIVSCCERSGVHLDTQPP